MTETVNRDNCPWCGSELTRHAQEKDGMFWEYLCGSHVEPKGCVSFKCLRPGITQEGLAKMRKQEENLRNAANTAVDAAFSAWVAKNPPYTPYGEPSYAGRIRVARDSKPEIVEKIRKNFRDQVEGLSLEEVLALVQPMADELMMQNPMYREEDGIDPREKQAAAKPALDIPAELRTALKTMKWSAPVVDPRDAARKAIYSQDPSPAFWSYWRAKKEEAKAAGVAVRMMEAGKFEVKFSYQA